MTAIINRTPTGRLISLLAEIKYLKARYHTKPFELKGLKYDSTVKENPLMYFDLAKKNVSIGFYDPYLRNPLSPAKFHLTQSIQHDTQKSKSASECLNSLEALGWVERSNNLSKLTSIGIRVAMLDYDSEEFFNITRESVLGYGVFIGFLFKCLKESIVFNGEQIVEKDRIEIGYKDTNEKISVDGKNISLSTGSQKDTIVRTRSTLFAWAVTTGFCIPINHPVPKKLSSWHKETLEEIAKKHWGWSKLRMFIPKNIFNGNHYVDRPLSYRWMTKSTKALRERGQQAVRDISLKEEEKVKNRRFAIVYCLALASKEKATINFQKLIENLSNFPALFVINEVDFKRVMSIEKDVAVVSGIPFSELDNILTPLTQVDLSILKEGVPSEVLRVIDSLFDKVRG